MAFLLLLLDVASRTNRLRGDTRLRSFYCLLVCFHLWILQWLLVVARRGRLVILSYTLILQVWAVEIRIVIRTYTLILLVLLCLDIRILHIHNILVLMLHVCLMRSVVAIARLLLIRVMGIRSILRIVNISWLCSLMLWWDLILVGIIVLKIKISM